MAKTTASKTASKTTAPAKKPSVSKKPTASKVIAPQAPRTTPAPMALIGLPAPANVGRADIQPLALGSTGNAKVNYSPLIAAKLGALQAQIAAIKPATATKVKGATATYKRPQKAGSCLAIWEWLDANPTATRKECQAWGEAVGINPITCGVQYGHWVKDRA